MTFQGNAGATAVFTTRRRQRTPAGIGVGSTVTQLKAAYPNARCRKEAPDFRHCWTGRFLPGRRVTDYRIDIPTDFSIRVKELAPIEIKPIEIRPLDLSIRLKEIPSVRGHLPLNYKVGLTLLGREVACVSLCGQGQFITEPYVPYPCEPKPQRIDRPDPRPNPRPIG